MENGRKHPLRHGRFQISLVTFCLEIIKFNNISYFGGEGLKIEYFEKTYILCISFFFNFSYLRDINKKKVLYGAFTVIWTVKNDKCFLIEKFDPEKFLIIELL